MKIKQIALKLAGGLLAAAFVVTALACNTDPAAADGYVCPGTCTVDTRPDLLLTKFDVTVDPDGMVNVAFKVKNAGLSNAGQFETWFFYNGLWKFISNKWAGLPAGGEYSGTFSFMGHCGGASRAVMKAVVDYDYNVNESNEGNNTVQKTVPC